MNTHAHVLQSTWKHYLSLAKMAGRRFYRNANCHWVLHDISHKASKGIMSVRTFLDNPHYILAPHTKDPVKYPGYLEFHALIASNPCPTGIKLGEDYEIDIKDLPVELQKERTKLYDASVRLANVEHQLRKLKEAREKLSGISGLLKAAGLSSDLVRAQRIMILNKRAALLREMRRIVIFASEQHVIAYQEKVLDHLGLTMKNPELAKHCSVNGELKISRCWWWPGHTCNFPEHRMGYEPVVIERYPQRKRCSSDTKTFS